MTISLRDVVLAIRYGEASLVAESAGYLVLGAADAARQSPTIASVDAVSLGEDGTVSLRGAPGTEGESEESLRFLLGQLLENVRAASPNLERVVGRRDLRSLRGLVEELEAALVPVNRRAAARTLARLFRETKRSVSQATATLQVQERPSPEIFLRAPVLQQAEPLPEEAPLNVAEALLPPVAVQVTEPRLKPPVITRASPPVGVLETIAQSFGATTPAPPEPPSSPEPPPEMGFAEGEHYVDVEEEHYVDVEEEPTQDDDIDEEPTQVFQGTIAPVFSGSWRGAKVDTRAHTPIPDDVSLIPKTRARAAHRPSDITALLDQSEVKRQATDELYSGLKTLSRVDLSPLAPPVGASWMDNERS